MLTLFLQTTTTDNSGKSDPYYVFLLRQATTTKNKQTKTKPCCAYLNQLYLGYWEPQMLMCHLSTLYRQHQNLRKAGTNQCLSIPGGRSHGTHVLGLVVLKEENRQWKKEFISLVTGCTVCQVVIKMQLWGLLSLKSMLYPDIIPFMVYAYKRKYRSHASLTLVLLRVFPKHIFWRGLLQPPSRLSIQKVI